MSCLEVLTAPQTLYVHDEASLLPWSPAPLLMTGLSVNSPPFAQWFKLAESLHEGLPPPTPQTHLGAPSNWPPKCLKNPTLPTSIPAPSPRTLCSSHSGFLSLIQKHEALSHIRICASFPPCARGCPASGNSSVFFRSPLMAFLTPQTRSPNICCACFRSHPSLLYCSRPRLLTVSCQQQGPLLHAVSPVPGRL